MDSHGVSRRSFLRGAGAAGAGVIAGSLAGGLLGAGPAAAEHSGSLPASKSFLFNTGQGSLAPTFVPRDESTPQSFAFDPSTGLLYVAAIPTGRGGDTPKFVQHRAAGDLTIYQFDPSTGRLLAQMDLAGCGHGFSIAAVPGAPGKPADIWFEFRSRPEGPEGQQVGYGTCVSHYPFTPTDPTTWEPIPAATLAQHLHDPEGSSTSVHHSPAYDPINDRMAIRYQADVNSVRKVVAIYSMDALRAGPPYTRLARIVLPDAVDEGQGFALYGDYLYFLSGTKVTNNCGEDYRDDSSYGQPSADGKPFQPTTLARLNINNETVYGPVQSNAFDTVGGREPEGMAIQLVGGAPRLCFGIAGRLAGSGNTDQTHYPSCGTGFGLNIATRQTLTAQAD